MGFLMPSGLFFRLSPLFTTFTSLSIVACDVVQDFRIFFSFQLFRDRKKPPSCSAFFRRQLANHEGTSTSKILQERFWGHASNSKVCLHLTFLRKSTLFCFFVRFGHVFDDLKKNFSRLGFSFFEATFWLRLLWRTIPNHQYQKKSLTIFWGTK